MKVAFAHYSTANDISGVTTWLTWMVERMCREGIQVAVHLHHSGADLSQASILPMLRHSGAEVSIQPRCRSLQADTRQTLAFLNAWQPSLFLPQCHSAHVMAAAIAGRQGLPWAMTLHSDDPEYWVAAESFPPPLHGGRTVCVSRHIQEQVISTGLDPHPWTIPCGVELPIAQAHHSDSPFRVAYSGRLWEHQKRIGLVTDSLIRACGRNTSIEATLFGDGHARNACEERVRQAGLQNAITFAGRLLPAQVQAELARCQAILLMSDFEGLPIALLEAMALGVVPVVRSIPSGIPELIEHERTGLLVSEDPLAAADALERLARDPALWNRCSRAARQLVRDRYSRDASYASWRQLLDDLEADSHVSYPLRLDQRIDTTKLHPLLTQPYRAPSRFRQRIRQELNTNLARLKHIARSVLAAR